MNADMADDVIEQKEPVHRPQPGGLASAALASFFAQKAGPLCPTAV